MFVLAAAAVFKCWSFKVHTHRRGFLKIEKKLWVNYVSWMLDITEYPGLLKGKLGVIYRVGLLKIFFWFLADTWARERHWTLKLYFPPIFCPCPMYEILVNAQSMQQVVLRVTSLCPNRTYEWTLKPRLEGPSFFFKAPWCFKMFYCIVVAATASQKRGLKVWPETQNGFPWMIAVISGQTSFSMVVHNNGQSNYHFFRSIWDALCYR